MACRWNVAWTALVLCLAVIVQGAQAAPRMLQLNDAPDDATLQRAGDGKAVPLSGQFGKKGTLVYFWHPKCKVCVDQLKTLDKTKLPEGITPVTLTAGQGDDVEKINEIAREVRLPVLMDEGLKVAIQFQATRLPAYYVLGPGGKLATPLLSPAKDGLKEPIEFYDNRSLLDILSQLSRKNTVPDIVLPHDRMIGKPAPDLSLATLEGGSAKLSSHKGAKGIVVTFYSPTCPHCQRELPRLHEYLTKTGYKKGYKALAVSIGNDDEKMQHIREYQALSKYTWPILIDPTGEALLNWKVEGYPTFFVLDGKLTLKAVQSGRVEDFDKFFSQALGE